MTEIQWGAAINTYPRVDGVLSGDLQSFIVYTWLTWWAPLSPDSLLRYDWANDWGSPIDQSYRCTYSLNPGADYTISFSDCSQLIGSTPPGLTGYHNNRPFSTYDADHDASASNCSGNYSNSPWWYGSCWDGNINGGGEWSGGHVNGAYWSGSANQWGTNAGVGGGNGWIFIK